VAQRTAPNARPGPIRTYEQILSDPYTADARQAIEKLTGRHHIAELDLRMRLAWFGACARVGTGRQWHERFTIDRRKAERLARRLREDGGELRKALTPQFKRVIGGFPTADDICNLISRAAVWIEGSLSEANDRKADWTLEPKRELTQFVWRTTGKPLDSLLADLIAAVLRLTKYSYEDQRKFRERHCHFEGVDSMFGAAPKQDNTSPING
jgi:hypothetical protein